MGYEVTAQNTVTGAVTIWHIFGGTQDAAIAGVTEMYANMGHPEWVGVSAVVSDFLK